MKFAHLLALALTSAAGSTTATAQQEPAAVVQAASAPSTLDCTTTMMKRHDHGAERGAGSTAKPMSCAVSAAASSPEKPNRKKPVHDHAKFHKNQ